jgi:hypothetical protein
MAAARPAQTGIYKSRAYPHFSSLGYCNPEAICLPYMAFQRARKMKDKMFKSPRKYNDREAYVRWQRMMRKQWWAGKAANFSRESV